MIDVGSPTTAGGTAGDGSGDGDEGEGVVDGLGVRGSVGHRYQKSQDIVIESA